MDEQYQQDREFSGAGGPMWQHAQPASGHDSPWLTPQPSQPPPRGHAWIAWCIIALACIGLIVMRALMPESTSAIAKAGEADRLGDMLIEFQAKYFVAAAQIQGNAGMLYDAAEASLNKGSLSVRQRFIVLAAELAGVEEAGRQLSRLSNDILTAEKDPDLHFSMTKDQQEVQNILQKLYLPTIQLGADGTSATSPASSPASAPTTAAAAIPMTAPATRPNVDELTRAERAELVQQLGWFGKLALNPPGGADQSQRDAVLAPAKELLYIVVSGAIAFAIAGFAGFVGLVVWLVLALMGRLKRGLRDSSWHHGIYAETFAVWLIVFFALQIGSAFLPVGSLAAEMLVTLVAFFLSLIALFWPVARGIPWSQVRQDIGWTAGRAEFAEPFVGFGGYFMTLPVLVIGVLITVVLLKVQQMYAAPPKLFEIDNGPAHPIIAELGSNWPVRILILMIGSIAAPIVEETMFRGVLYRHLRGATAGAGVGLSIAISAVASSFLFAAIHPQGWVAIPALMSLAIMFALMREWRGTLIPSMVMHGTSNFLVMTMVIVIASL